MDESTDFSTDFFDESTNFVLLSAATTPPPHDTISLSRPAVFCPRRVNFFGYYPKSEDFSELRLDNLVVPHMLCCCKKIISLKRYLVPPKTGYLTTKKSQNCNPKNMQGTIESIHITPENVELMCEVFARLRH